MQRLDELPGDGANLLLGKALVILQDLEELALRELGDDAKLSLGLERIHHADDVVVLQPAENLDLLAQGLDVLLRLAVLRDELHGGDLARELATRLVHAPERTLAHELEDVVIVRRSRAASGNPVQGRERGAGIAARGGATIRTRTRARAGMSAHHRLGVRDGAPRSP